MHQPKKSYATPRADKIGGSAPNIFGYIRVSTADQADHGSSLETQRERITDWALVNGHPSPEFFADEGLSGSKVDRPEFRRMMTMVRAGDFIIVSAIDRFARSSTVFHQTMDEIADIGAKFISLSQNFDTSTLNGKLAASTMAGIAEWERGMIKERTSLGVSKARAAGKWAGGAPPFGYRRNTDGFLVGVDAEVAVVRLMFEARARGLSLSSIADELNVAGLETRSKSRWRTGTVANVLDQSGYVDGKHVSVATRKATGSKMPVIIDGNVYLIAEKVRLTNRFKRPSSSGAPWPLQAGTCGCCGRPWGVHSNSHTDRVYFCRGREIRHGDDPSRTRCAVPRQPADDLESAVLLAIKETLNDPKSYKVAVEAGIARLHSDEARLSKDRRPIERELSEKQESLDRLIMAWADHGLSTNKYHSKRAKIDSQVTYLKNQLKALGSDSLEELERTRRLIVGAEHLSMIADQKAAAGIGMRRVSFLRSLWPTQDSKDFISSDGILGDLVASNDTVHSLRELLSRLAADVYFYGDHLEIRGHLPVTAMYPDRSSSQPPRGLGCG